MTKNCPGIGCALAVVLVSLAGMSTRVAPLAADELEPDSAPRHTARSPRLAISTDLTADQADDLLRRMELTLDKAVDHWGRPVRERIECYVIDNLDNWPDSALPHPVARMIVGNVGGAAFARRVGAGIQARHEVKVLASSDPDIAVHEVVHAYCGQVFGTTGPWWYREGMAQMITFGYDDCRGLQCPPEVWEQLHAGDRKSIPGILGSGESAEQLKLALEDKIARQDAATGPWPDFVSLGEWNENDTHTLKQMEQFYAWSWLLCHMLHHNPNYRRGLKPWDKTTLPVSRIRFPTGSIPFSTNLCSNTNSCWTGSGGVTGSICAAGIGRSAFAASTAHARSACACRPRGAINQPGSKWSAERSIDTRRRGVGAQVRIASPSAATVTIRDAAGLKPSC